MLIESVRSLKAELVGQILPEAIRESAAIRQFGIAARSLERRVQPTIRIVLGVARGRGAADYRLAVRLQNRALEADAGLVERIQTVAKKEVDVQYIGRVGKRARRSAAGTPWHQQKLRPLLIGGSVGHVDVTAGTIGSFCRGPRGAATFVLSNNHVLANEDRGRPEDTVLQPGQFDGGRAPRDRIGGLSRAVRLSPRGNEVDAALAQLDGTIRIEPTTIRGLGTLRGVREPAIEPGDEVAKVGRTTGVTHGRVTAIEVDGVVVDYDIGQLVFDNQLEIEGGDAAPFSAGGDSGSLIVDLDGYACGLLFAGSDQGGSNGKGLTYANDIRRVLARLRATMVA